MGLFDDLNEMDLSGEYENPDAVKTGTYPAEISSATVGETKSGDKIGVTVKAKIVETDDSDEYVGRVLQLWQQVPTSETQTEANNGDTKAKRVIFYFKNLMKNLGVEESKFKKIDEEFFNELVGEDVYINVQGASDGGFPQVKTMRERQEKSFL